MSDFVHLHVHTEFSLLDGLCKIGPIIKKVKEFGMDSVAITDHGALYGAVDFYLKAKDAGVNPIVGVETYVAKRSRFDKENGVDNEPYHLLLLAKDYIGYKNLLKLVSTSYLDGFYYKPRVDKEILRQCSEGLIATSACLAGEVSQYFLANDPVGAKKAAQEYADIFGKGNFFIELQNHPNILEVGQTTPKLVALARELGLPLVATNDAHYINPDDAEAQEVLLCIQTQKQLNDSKRGLSMISSPDFYIRSGEEMSNLFAEYPEAVSNTKRIADMCHLEIPAGKKATWLFPKYEIPEGYTHDQWLKKVVYEKVSERYPEVTDDIRKRIDNELHVIKVKGYAPYFLYTWDYVHWSKEHRIAVGPGRGSGAGSVVSYILGITGIDPFFFELPFERFLNEFRPTPPDFDIDFQDSRRQEVVDYITRRHGEAKVAQIITFGTMEARGSIRDVARVLGWAYSRADKIAKLIPMGSQGMHMTLDKALELTPDLKNLYDKDPDTKRLIDLAKKLEGVARHASTHAAGVVVAPEPLVNFAPLQKVSNGEGKMIQYDMRKAEEIGLLKSDILGLRNLTIISEAIDIIERQRGVRVDIEKIPLTDKKTFELLGKGQTMAVFQLESAGMQRNIKELKPESVFDLMAMVALYRPGPMQVIPLFIKSKNNPELITYLVPQMKEILKKSYGVITYQDDVLLLAIHLAGYTWEEADGFRKAMGKKIPTLMAKQEQKFVNGCIKNGIAKETAEQIFKLISPFAGYGFNKAHAASYGMIAYWTAWLKANYPDEYMCAVLTAEAGNKDKLAEMVTECKNMGIAVLPPHINKSEMDFSLEPTKNGHKAIRFGLSAIKNVGVGAVDSILAARKKKGDFTSMADFVTRVDTRLVNKKVLDSLIKTGAFEGFATRASLLQGEALILDYGHNHAKAHNSSNGQSSIFDLHDDLGGDAIGELKLPVVTELPRKELLAYEKELLGFYLTEHPLSSVLSLISAQVSHKIGWIEGDEIVSSKKKIVIGGVITSVRKTFTKKTNAEMAFAKIEDETGSIELVVFPKIYEISKQYWEADQIVLLTGKADIREDQLSFVVEEVTPFSKIENNGHSIRKDEIEIKVPRGVKPEILKEINELLRENPGESKVVMLLPNGGDIPKRLRLPFGVSYSVDLARQINRLLKTG